MLEVQSQEAVVAAAGLRMLSASDRYSSLVLAVFIENQFFGEKAVTH